MLSVENACLVLKAIHITLKLIDVNALLLANLQDQSILKLTNANAHSITKIKREFTIAVIILATVQLIYLCGTENIASLALTILLMILLSTNVITVLKDLKEMEQPTHVSQILMKTLLMHMLIAKMIKHLKILVAIKIKLFVPQKLFMIFYQVNASIVPMDFQSINRQKVVFQISENDKFIQIFN